MRIKSLITLLASLICCTAQAETVEPLSVKLATTDWPPYVEQHTSDHGFIYQIINLAFQKSGYQTTINFYPWKEALKLSKYHNDGFFPAYDRSDQKNLACSDVIYSGPIGFFKRKDSDIQFKTDPTTDLSQALHDLANYKFGIVDGYVNPSAFDQAKFLHKKTAISDTANLEQLKKGKVDLIVSDVFVALALIDKNKPKFNDIELMSPSVEVKKDYLCFSTSAPDYQAKLAAFNRGLNIIQKDGELDGIVAKSGN